MDELVDCQAWEVPTTDQECVRALERLGIVMETIRPNQLRELVHTCIGIAIPDEDEQSKRAKRINSLSTKTRRRKRH